LAFIYVDEFMIQSWYRNKPATIGYAMWALCSQGNTSLAYVNYVMSYLNWPACESKPSFFSRLTSREKCVEGIAMENEIFRRAEGI
jgi:hypothetical protein